MDNVSIPAAPQPPKSFAQKLVSSWSTVRAFAVKHQRPIFVIGVVLILGVVVAWSQFGVEISRFFAASQCSGAPGYSGSLSFSASKYSITTPGEEITLNWSGTGEACTLSGPDFSESQAELSGSRTVHPTQQTTYSVQCYSSVSPQGSCSDSITINVVAPKPSPKTEITITTKGQRYPTNHALTWNTTPGSSDVGADRFKCSGRATNASALDEGMADWVNHDFLGGSPNYVVYAKAKTDIWLFCWAEPSSLGIANWESNHITVEPVTITTTLQDVSGPSAGTARTLTWDTAPGTSALQAGTIYCEGVAGNPSALTNSSDWVGKRFLGGSQGYVVNLKMATSTTLNLFCYTDGSPKPPNWESNKITVGPIGGGAALSCSPASQTKGTGETVSFNAVGAVGPYNWSAPSGSTTTGTGSSFSTTYGAAGSYVVTVTGGAQTATCNVTVTGAGATAPTCSPATQSVQVGQAATFSSGGGNGTYSWSAPGGSPANGTQGSFNTTYTTTGQKTVTLTSAGQTDTCSVNVTAAAASDCAIIQTISNDFVEGGAGVCRNSTYSGGTMQATFRVTDAGNDGLDLVANAYHCTDRLGNAQSSIGFPPCYACNPGPATNESPDYDGSNIGSMTITGQTHFAPHESGQFTVTYDASAFNCGRVQVDSGITNGTLCNNASGVFYAGMVTYPASCGGVQSTPSRAPSPSPTQATLACNTTVSTANVNEVVAYSATGGTGTYSWASTPDGTAPNSNQATYNVQYPTAGQKTATVTSGSQTATCTVNINAVTLTCSPSTQTHTTNEVATLSATGGTGTYSWSAPSGSPATGSGSSFGVAYAAASGATPYQVTVTSGSQTATCAVAVTTPPAGLACSPSSQSAWVGQTANFSATGGTGTYSWSAPSGSPTTGSGAYFSAQYPTPGSYSVTLTSGSETQTCAIAVNQLPSPSPTQPVVILTPALSISKAARNVTQGSSEATVVSANPGDTIEFIIRVNSIGNSIAQGVRVSDSLPYALSYISGSTTVDGANNTDGIVSSGILLGDLVSGRTVTVRFRATVAGESSFSYGTSTLTNTVTGTSTNVSTVSNVAFVNVSRPQPTGTYQLSIAKYGRNVTRGDVSEQTSVQAAPNDTIEFIIRVRSLSSAQVTNVTVADVIPSGISYLSGTTSVNGVVTNDNIVSSQGLNIGALNPNQEAIIRFSGRVNSASTLPAGITTAMNTAQGSATSATTVIAQLPVVISNGTIAGISRVPTGARESILLALAISLIVTMMYVTYTRTQLFKRREVESIVREDRGNKDRLNFKL